MKRILAAAFLLIHSLSHTQYTPIPDVNFEQALIDLGLDTGNPDGSVFTNNIDSVTSLNLEQKNITNLTGIEDFISLEILICNQNLLTTVDLSNNINLKVLHIYECQLTELNLTQNPLIEYLFCNSNKLTTLDLSKNLNLLTLHCYDNRLTFLDISQNTGLLNLDCGYSNQLTSLDVSHCKSLNFLFCDNNLLECLNVKNGNNGAIELLEAYNNPKLECVKVDDPIVEYSYWATHWEDTHPGIYLSSDCGDFCPDDIDQPNSNNKVLIKVVDLTGRETPANTKGLTIHIYSDGTIVKRFVME